MITNSYLPNNFELSSKRLGNKEHFSMEDFFKSMELLHEIISSLRNELSIYLKECRLSKSNRKRQSSSLLVYKRVRKCIEIVLMAEEIQKGITNLHKLIEKRKKYTDLKVYKLDSNVQETPALVGTIYHEIDQCINTTYNRISNIDKSKLDTTEMYLLSKLKAEMKEIKELNHKFQLANLR